MTNLSRAIHLFAPDVDTNTCRAGDAYANLIPLDRPRDALFDIIILKLFILKIIVYPICY